jgi:hypothetical protein
MLSRLNSEFLHLHKERFQLFKAYAFDNRVADLIFCPLSPRPSVRTGAIDHVPVLSARFKASSAVSVFESLISVWAKNTNFLRSPDGSISPEGQREVRLEPLRGKVTASPLDTTKLIGIKAVADHIIWPAIILKPILERLSFHAIGTESGSVSNLESPGLNYNIKLVFGLPVWGVAVSDFHAQVIGNFLLKSLDVLSFGSGSNVMVEENNAVFAVPSHCFDGNQRRRMAARIAVDVSRILQFSSPSASAFSEPSSSVLAGRPAPHLLSCLILAGFLSCGKPFISQTLAINCGDERVQPVQSVICYVASIQPEGDFIDVPSNVFGANVMPSSIDAAFEECPDGLQSIE